MKQMTPRQLRSYMISKQGKAFDTWPEKLFDSFQESRGLGLVKNVYWMRNPA